MPNNRQLAFIIWVVFVAGWALSLADVRTSLRKVAHALNSWKLLLSLALLTGWVLLLIATAERIGLWNSDRATDTAVWFVTAGLVLFAKFDRVSKEPHFVRRAALATVGATAVVQAVSELAVLSLVAEVLLQPVLAVLAMMSVYATGRNEHRQIKTTVDALLTVAGVALLLHVAISLLINWTSVDKVDLAQQLALPIWMTVGVLPFIYFLGLWAAYGGTFTRLDWRSEASWSTRVRQKAALITSFHGNATDVGSFGGRWQLKLAEAKSFRDARKVIDDFRDAEREAARREDETEARLLRYADVDGVDEQGLRLDRREFEATTEALRWISTCHMGWYRRDDRSHYRGDLLSFVLDGYACRDLPNPTGIEMHVSADGQKWFAWRRTVSGWVFAIGAAGPPPDQWEYDGAEPPDGFPGEDPAWGGGPHLDDANGNW